jgi:hypothetical protein
VVAGEIQFGYEDIRERSRHQRGIVRLCTRLHLAVLAAGADVLGAFASKLGRGEVKAWVRGEPHSPPITSPYQGTI